MYKNFDKILLQNFQHLIKTLPVVSVLFSIVVIISVDDNYFNLGLEDKETIIYLSSMLILNAILNLLKDKVSQGYSEYRKFLINEIEQEGNLSNEEDDDTKIEDDEEKTTKAKKSDKKDILIQMLNNNDEITDYFKISKRQAQSSFWFSIIACIIGIITICLSLYAVFEIKDMKFAIVSIAGGTITELIAGTVLVIHNKSALQLNYYYDALHENERFLSAINLADKLDEDTKKQLYIEIIKKQIGIERKDKKEEKDTDENNSN